jgi:hypothetical protein
MSWQATAWAIKQTTGSPAAKLLLLTLANYADADGCCWPSQEVLAEDTEQSVDTVQRQLKKLVEARLIRKVPRSQGPGRWASRTYFLDMGVAKKTKPQSAARSEDEQPEPSAESDRSPIGVTGRNASVTLAEPTMPQGTRDHAATSPVTMPQPARDHAAPLRHKPSLEPESEPSLEASSSSSSETLPSNAPKPKPTVEERQKAFRVGRKGVEVIQNRIAQKIGFDGWEILQSLDEPELHRVTTLEERGRLDASAVERLRLDHVSAKRKLGGRAA